MTASLEVFLDLLFEPGETILVDVIEERRPGVARPRSLARRWWPPAKVAAMAPTVAAWALERKAAVYFGVLPRQPETQAASGAYPGRVVWADLDDEESRNRLAAWRTPTITVSSGRGLHGYWCLTETYQAPILVAATARVGGLLGGDHVWDAARVLRLPGTWWSKADPPRPVEVRDVEPGRRWALAELLEGVPVAAPSTVTGKRIAVNDVGDPPAWLIARIESDHRLLAYWKGEAGGPSRSERDYKLALALAVRGVRDPKLLAAALLARPEGAARNRPDPADYLGRTVARALAMSAGWRRR
jgi:hypothetical protein